MSSKSPILGAILGFFILGLFYSTGVNKKGAITVLGLVVVSYIAGMISPYVSLLVNFAGAFLGYKWASEHNAGGSM